MDIFLLVIYDNLVAFVLFSMIFDKLFSVSFLGKTFISTPNVFLRILPNITKIIQKNLDTVSLDLKYQSNSPNISYNY